MEKNVMQSDYEGQPEFVESDKELADYLSEIAEEIGWIVIYFNSLEDTVAQCLREMMLRDPYQDERLDVFLAEMGYQAKVRALIHLYGQTSAHRIVHLPDGELTSIEKALSLGATIRNGYAHADWIGLRTDAYIKVKTRSSRNGVIHRYKRFNTKTTRFDIRFIKSLRDRLDAVHELVLDQIHSRISLIEVRERVLPEIKFPPTDEDESREGILNALMALGYPDKEVQVALGKVPVGVSVSDGIRLALQVL
jgi:hypothetical protein